MAMSRVILRAGAVGACVVAGGVYAASAGFIPMPGGRDAGPAPTPVALPAPPAGGAGLLTQQASLATQGTGPMDVSAVSTEVAPVAVAAPEAGGGTPAPVPLGPVEDGAGEAVELAALTPDAMPQPMPQPIPMPLDDRAMDDGGFDGRGLDGRLGSDRPDPARAETPQAADTPDPIALSPFGLPCDVEVTATPIPPAMVGLDILAPCMPATRVEIAHSGLTLSMATDAMGLLTLDLPAFEASAFFEVRFADGSAHEALVAVPDLDGYTRVGLAWAGDRALELHAMEGGAAFGAPGHVWHETPGSIGDTIDGTAGHLLILGDATLDSPMLAHVYTVPRATPVAGDVAISIDAPITEANCGLPTEAVTLRREAGGALDITELNFTTPGCDAVGDILVLQNLMGPLRIAAN